MDLIIHQIWFQGFSNIPDKYKKYRSSWEKNYNIEFWDEKRIQNLLSTNYPKYYNWWNNLPLMIQKIDIAKAFILHAYGGIYADIDTELVKRFDNLIENNGVNKIIVGKIGLDFFSNTMIKLAGNLDYLINNGLIYSPKHHPFWKFYINGLYKTVQKPNFLESMFETLYVMVSSGPIHFTDGILYYINKYPQNNNFVILDNSILEPGVYSDDPSSYIKHHHSISWAGPGTRFLMASLYFIEKNKKILLFIIILIILIYIFYKFYRKN